MHAARLVMCFDTASIENDSSAKLSTLTDAPTNFATAHPSFNHTVAQIYSHEHPPTTVSIRAVGTLLSTLSDLSFASK